MGILYFVLILKDCLCIFLIQQMDFIEFEISESESLLTLERMLIPVLSRQQITSQVGSRSANIGHLSIIFPFATAVAFKLENFMMKTIKMNN